MVGRLVAYVATKDSFLVGSHGNNFHAKTISPIDVFFFKWKMSLISNLKKKLEVSSYFSYFTILFWKIDVKLSTCATYRPKTVKDLFKFFSGLERWSSQLSFGTNFISIPLLVSEIFAIKVDRSFEIPLLFAQSYFIWRTFKNISNYYLTNFCILDWSQDYQISV